MAKVLSGDGGASAGYLQAPLWLGLGLAATGVIVILGCGSCADIVDDETIRWVLGDHRGQWERGAMSRKDFWSSSRK